MNIWPSVLLAAAMAFSPVRADETSAPPADWKEILNKQQLEIDSLKQKMEKMEDQETPSGPEEGGFRLSDKLILSGRGSAVFFSSEDNGAYPNDEFAIDEARIRLEAKLDEDIYFFTEINLADREDPRDGVWLGEFYVDFENITQYWNSDLPINLRLGRFDIPYGEEYKRRDSIDNALISHSLTDFWGVDEGIAVFGAAGKWDYIVAVQNGGPSSYHDYDSDKAVAARIGFNPSKAWRISLSAMRTGDLNSQEDESSEIWYGGGVFRGIGPAATNGTFCVDLYQMDLKYKWNSGHIYAMAGATHYDDDQVGDNQHDCTFFSVEAVQDITERWFLASRYSLIDSSDGMPIVGQGTYYPDFVSDDLTTEIWRLSLGTGFRINKHLVAKAEYSLEDGEKQSGAKLDDRNLLSAQLAFDF